VPAGARRFGRLDLLFNNAGVSLPVQTPDEIDAATWRRAVDTNLNGAFFCLAGAFKMMRHQSPMGGRIINNGSISAMRRGRGRCLHRHQARHHRAHQARRRSTAGPTTSPWARSTSATWPAT
jgi:NAD(P)-dependent dehydrogenase (short-subunit alcohol dehydrogenase family)